MTHASPVATVALALAIILVVAQLGADLAKRVGQPAVLGELLVGVVLGNLLGHGMPLLESIKSEHVVDTLAHFGALILLFEVGLESSVGQMLRVGGSARVPIR